MSASPRAAARASARAAAACLARLVWLVCLAVSGTLFPGARAAAAADPPGGAVVVSLTPGGRAWYRVARGAARRGIDPHRAGALRLRPKYEVFCERGTLTIALQGVPVRLTARDGWYPVPAPPVRPPSGRFGGGFAYAPMTTGLGPLSHVPRPAAPAGRGAPPIRRPGGAGTGGSASVFGWYARATDCMASKQYDKAAEAFRHVAALAPAPGVYDALSLAYRKAGRDREALNAATKALSLDPRDAAAHLNRGELYARLSDDTRALADYAAALALDPALGPQVILARADLLARRGDFAGAARDYTAYLATSPGDLAARYSRGLAYYKAGDARAALPDIQAFVARRPSDEEAQRLLASVSALVPPPPPVPPVPSPPPAPPVPPAPTPERSAPGRSAPSQSAPPGSDGTAASPPAGASSGTSTAASVRAAYPGGMPVVVYVLPARPTAVDRYRASWLFYSLDDREVRRYAAQGYSGEMIRGAANVALRTGLDVGYVLERARVGGCPLSGLAAAYGLPPECVDVAVPGIGAASYAYAPPEAR